MAYNLTCVEGGDVKECRGRPSQSEGVEGQTEDQHADGGRLITAHKTHEHQEYPGHQLTWGQSKGLGSKATTGYWFSNRKSLKLYIAFFP